MIELNQTQENIFFFDIEKQLKALEIEKFDGLNFFQMYHEANFLCGMITQNEKLMNIHFHPLQEIMNQKQVLKGNDYHRVDVLNQLLRYYLSHHFYDKAKKNIDQIQEIVINTTVINKLDKISITADVLIFEMHILIQLRELNKVDDFLKRVSVFIEKNKNEIPQKFFLLYESNLLVIYFLLKDFKQVVKLTNKVLSNKKSRLRNDVIVSVMLIEIVTFYELESFRLFESRLEAFDNFIKRHDLNEVMWKMCSELLNSFLTDFNEKDSIKNFLEKVEEHKNNRIVNDLDFLIQWAKGRLNK